MTCSTALLFDQTSVHRCHCGLLIWAAAPGRIITSPIRTQAQIIPCQTDSDIHDYSVSVHTGRGSSLQPHSHLNLQAIPLALLRSHSLQPDFNDKRHSFRRLYPHTVGPSPAVPSSGAPISIIVFGALVKNTIPMGSSCLVLASLQAHRLVVCLVRHFTNCWPGCYKAVMRPLFAAISCPSLLLFCFNQFSTAHPDIRSSSWLAGTRLPWKGHLLLVCSLPSPTPPILQSPPHHHILQHGAWSLLCQRATWEMVIS
ncbi:hypothetical protein V8F20_003049 [Naviculisporaceae sp. PSN 640]